MSIETIPVSGLWRFLRWLPGAMLRWHFTPERLAQLIYVDLRPRHESATVDLGEASSFTLYLQLINLSPFAVELDRANFRFWFGGVTIDALIIQRQVIAAGSSASLCIHQAIPDGHANQMARQFTGNPVALGGNIEFNSKVRAFAKNVGHLDGINPKVYNAHIRVATQT